LKLNSFGDIDFSNNLVLLCSELIIYFIGIEHFFKVLNLLSFESLVGMAQLFFKIGLAVEDLPCNIDFVWVNVVNTGGIEVVLLGPSWPEDSLSGGVDHFLVGISSRLVLFLEELLIRVLLDILLHCLICLLLL
jgi:hypothetical protein